MTLLQIEYFLEVARLQSFTKAAEKLYISHQALSLQIKALEEELGMELFDRSNKRKLVLRENGEILFYEWSALLEKNREAIRRAKSIYEKQKNIMRVGIQNVVYIRDLTLPVINKYLTEHNLGVEFFVDSPDALLDKLHAGEIDVCSVISTGLLHRESVKFREIGLKRAKPIIAVSKDNPLAQKDKLTLKDIADETIIVFNESYARDAKIRITKDFADEGLTIRKFRTLNNIQEVKLAVCMNQGVTLMLDQVMVDVLDKVKLYEYKEVKEEDMARIILAWEDDKWNDLRNE